MGKRNVLGNSKAYSGQCRDTIHIQFQNSNLAFEKLTSVHLLDLVAAQGTLVAALLLQLQV
jgi:hypothetical protein